MPEDTQYKKLNEPDTQTDTDTHTETLTEIRAARDEALAGYARIDAGLALRTRLVRAALEGRRQ